MLEPVGPLPASVYRRRRAVALAVVVVLLGLVTWGAAALLGGSDGAEGDAAAAIAPGQDPRARPAAFAAAEQAERAERDRTAGERAATDERTGRAAAPGSATPTAPAPSTGPSPTTSAPPVLPTPSGADGRGLLPGAVLGPLPTTTPAPSARSAPAPSAPSGTPRPPGTPGGPPPGPPAARAAAPPPRCADDAVSVLARTDRPRYAAGEKPVLSLVVRNTGRAACVRDLDAARQAVAVVRKPGDGLWSSNDCGGGHTTDVRVLRPGEEAVFSVRWSGRTSAPGCPTSREDVPPGRYQLLARLDRTISDPVAFTLGG